MSDVHAPTVPYAELPEMGITSRLVFYTVATIRRALVRGAFFAWASFLASLQRQVPAHSLWAKAIPPSKRPARSNILQVAFNLRPARVSASSPHPSRLPGRVAP